MVSSSLAARSIRPGVSLAVGEGRVSAASGRGEDVLPLRISPDARRRPGWQARRMAIEVREPTTAERTEWAAMLAAPGLRSDEPVAP